MMSHWKWNRHAWKGGTAGPEMTDWPAFLFENWQIRLLKPSALWAVHGHGHERAAFTLTLQLSYDYNMDRL